MLKNEFVGKIINSLSQIVGQSQTFFAKMMKKSAFHKKKPMRRWASAHNKSDLIFDLGQMLVDYDFEAFFRRYITDEGYCG